MIARRAIAVSAALVAIALLAVALRIVVSRPSSAQASGTVLSVISEEVLVQRPGAAAPVKAKDGQALREGDRVITRQSGRAVITFFEGSTQSIEPNTAITLKRLGSKPGGGLFATIGETVGTTWTTVFNTSDAGANVQVESPAATAAVRDTMFHVRVAPGGKTSVWTRQGTVAVTARGNVTEVTADTKLVVGPGSGSPPPVLERAPSDELTLTLDGAGWMLVRDPDGYSSGLVPPGAPVNQIPLTVIDDPSVRPQSVSLVSLVDGTYNVYMATREAGSFRLTADDGRGWATQCLQTSSGSIQPGETWLVKMKLDIADGKLVGCSLSDPERTHDNPYARIRVPNPMAAALAAGRHVIPEVAVLGASARPQPSTPVPGEAIATSAPHAETVPQADTAAETPSGDVAPAPTDAPPPTLTAAPGATATAAVPTISSEPPPAATDVPPATVPPSATDTPLPTIAPSPVPTATLPPPPPPAPSATSTPAPTSTPIPTATPSGPCAPAWADLNGDGAVTSADVTLVTSWFGQTSPPAPSAYDVNHDGRIDINDIQMVQAYLGLNVCP